MLPPLPPGGRGPAAAPPPRYPLPGAGTRRGRPLPARMAGGPRGSRFHSAPPQPAPRPRRPLRRRRRLQEPRRAAGSPGGAAASLPACRRAGEGGRLAPHRAERQTGLPAAGRRFLKSAKHPGGKKIKSAEGKAPERRAPAARSHRSAVPAAGRAPAQSDGAAGRGPARPGPISPVRPRLSRPRPRGGCPAPRSLPGHWLRAAPPPRRARPGSR